jgi:hypothetical protein
MRTVCLAIALVPYIYFGLNDNLLHLRTRTVCWRERLLHLAIVAALATVIPQAFFGHHVVMLAGLVLFVAARALDEYVFHRGLSAAESDLHAKTHLAFLMFIVVVLVVDWLETSLHGE